MGLFEVLVCGVLWFLFGYMMIDYDVELVVVVIFGVVVWVCGVVLGVCMKVFV